MKKINLFITLLIVCLCSGCSSIKYNLKFGEQISETMSAKIEIKKNDINDELGYYISPFQALFGHSSYNNVEDKLGECKASKTFESLNDFINNSIIFNKIFDKNIIDVHGTKVKINIDSKKYKNIGKKIDRLPIEISVYIPYYVSKHNADKVNNNTYTWNITDLENDSIQINFDMSKSSNYVNKTIYVYIIIGLSVIIVGVVIYFVMKNKKANEI